MKLHVPQQVEPDKDDFPNHPRKVKKWLSSLQKANMGEYARQIYNALLKLNRQAMPPKYRIENMEELRQPVRHIFDHLHKHFVNRTLPLPDKSLKIVTLNQALLQEIITGYKALIFEASNNINKLDSKQLLLAGERSLHYYSELQLRSSQIYMDMPEGSWWDIHHIYAYLESKDLHTKKIKDHEVGQQVTTVEQLYKELMLFALCRPNALRQSDAERVYRGISEWALKTRVSDKPVANKLNRYHCARLDSDDPPACMSSEEIQKYRQIRCMQTDILIDTLRNQIDDADTLKNAVAFGDQVSQETLRSLVSSWSLCARRRFSRAERQADIKVAIGLTPIFDSLKKTTSPPEGRMKKPASMFSLESIPEHERAKGDIFDQQNPNIFLTHPAQAKNDRSADAWDMVAKGRTLTESYAEELESQDREMGQLNREDPDLHWVIANVSAGGYCLRWEGDYPSRALVGDLIGIREKEPDNTFQWRVGVIRWMHFSQERGLEIGVQVLSPKVINCSVKRLTRLTEEPFKCLMLPGIKPIQQPSTLLLPAHAFKKGNELRINVYERDMDIKLGSIREHTGSFTQFQFAQLHPEEPSKEKDRKKSGSDDFDSIWSSL